MVEIPMEKERTDKCMQFKCTPRLDIRDRAALEDNFRTKFNELNRAHLHSR